jgi:prophage regulatory protein
MTQTKLIRINEVLLKTGKAKSSLYKDIAEGNFPKPIKIGIRSVAWIESEVDSYISNRISQSRNSQGA